MLITLNQVTENSDLLNRNQYERAYKNDFFLFQIIIGNNMHIKIKYTDCTYFIIQDSMIAWVKKSIGLKFTTLFPSERKFIYILM